MLRHLFFFLPCSSYVLVKPPWTCYVFCTWWLRIRCSDSSGVGRGCDRPRGKRNLPWGRKKCKCYVQHGFARKSHCLPTGSRSAFHPVHTSKRTHHLWQHSSVKRHLAAALCNMGSTQGLKELHLWKFLRPALKQVMNATEQSPVILVEHTGSKTKKLPHFHLALRGNVYKSAAFRQAA